MIEYADDAVVKMVSQILEIPPESFYYGSYASGLNAHIRKTQEELGIDDVPKTPGTIVLPFVSWIRYFTYYPESKETHTIQVREGSVSKLIKYMWIVANYTIETLTDSIIEQNNQVRNYFLYSGTTPSVSFTFKDTKFNLMVEFDEPQDTSELDDEEDIGRRIRTTYSIRVRVPIAQEKLERPPVDNVIARVPNYYPESNNQLKPSIH